MDRWEYEYAYIGAEDLQGGMNYLGQDGWEIFSVNGILLKRPEETTSGDWLSVREEGAEFQYLVYMKRKIGD